MDSAHLSCQATWMVRDRAQSWRQRGRSQAVDQAQDVGEHASRDRELGELERDIAAVAHVLRSNLDQPFTASANVGFWLQGDIQSPEIEVCSSPNFGHSGERR